MKRYRSLSIIMLVLLMLLVGCTGGTTEVYEQSTEPFTIDDVTGILGGLTTVGDYVDAVEPTNYSWFFIGEATGETQLVLNNPDGIVEIRFKTQSGSIAGEAEGESEQLPDDILSLPATVTAIEWLNENFVAIATIRGIDVGANKEKVLSGYLRTGNDADVMYTIEDINAQADMSWIAEWAIVGGRFIPKGGSGGFYEWDTLEYGWCELTGPDVWKEYYKLVYELDNNVVRSIRLYIEGDEKEDPTE